jgi:hypothetical protein
MHLGLVALKLEVSRTPLAVGHLRLGLATDQYHVPNRGVERRTWAQRKVSSDCVKLVLRNLL